MTAAPASLVSAGIHPRLWVTPNDLPRLRSWATTANAVWDNGSEGLLHAANNAVADADPRWSWSFNGGTGMPLLPETDPNVCTSTTTAMWCDMGYPGSGGTTEQTAELFAFMSLVHPDAATRDGYARRAKDMLMWIMNQAVLGPTGTNYVPFRHQQFSTYDRARQSGEAFPLIVDWIYSYLSAADKATIRTVFMRWASENITQSPTGGGYPRPVGVLNNSTLLSNVSDIQWVTNNYYGGHARNVTLFSMALDPADDPGDPTAAIASDGTTPCLRGYYKVATGGYLYQMFAAYEDPAVVSAALGIPQTTPSLGLANGGMPAEGAGYGGASLGYVSEMLLALHTAGMDDPAIAGKQIGLESSSYWSLWANGYLNWIEPAQYNDVNGVGLVYRQDSYEENSRLFSTWGYIHSFGSLGAYDVATGNATRANTWRWIARETLPGGAPGLPFRVGHGLSGTGSATYSILYFLMFDPNATVSDPHSAYPVEHFAHGQGELQLRSDWSTTASWLGYHCSWIATDHQGGDCNQFGLYRKGEWLTKQRTGTFDNGWGQLSSEDNALTVQNTGVNTSVNAQVALQGGQWLYLNNGAPTVQVSTGNGYAYTFADATNLYNSPVYGASDTLHVSRSMLWLQPDMVVIYDRATSKSANMFKRFNLQLIGTPSVSGSVTTATNPSGQKLVVKTVLPAAPSITSSTADSFSLAQLEPTQFKLVIEDATRPNDARYLHVLTAADANAPVTQATLLQSSAGAAFDGVNLGGWAVLFMRNTADSAAFATTTYIVTAQTKLHYVSGLSPNKAYSFTAVAGANGTTQLTVTAGGNLASDSAGVLRFSIP